MSCRRLFVGNPASMTSCASTFRRHEASRHRSVGVAVHHFRTPLAAAERSSSLRGHFWTTRAHHQQSTHAGVRALAGYQMPSTCRVSTSPIGGRPAADFTNVVNTTNSANWNRGISMPDRSAHNRQYPPRASKSAATWPHLNCWRLRSSTIFQIRAREANCTMIGERVRGELRYV